METVRVCDLCGCSEQKIFETYERYAQTFILMECLNCGLAYLEPRPTQSEMGIYYDEAYSSHHGIYPNRRC